MPTYGDVRTKFIARMNRRDMATTDADGYLQDAITRIQRTLRVPAMEKAYTVTLDATYASNGGVLIPADFLQLRQITINDLYELQKEDTSYVVPLAFYEKGLPKAFCRRGGLWVLAPYPDSVALTTGNDTLRVDYYAEFGSMLVPTDETILTDIASDLLVYGALSYASDHYNDKRGDRFEQRYLQIKDDIEGMGDEDETSGSASVQPAYFLNDSLDGDA